MRQKNKIKRIPYNLYLEEDIKRKLFSLAYGRGRRANELLEEILRKGLKELEEKREDEVKGV